MGLSGPKKRTKLSHDPNNNVWARSANFGQKIMAQQGWKPGDLLGATDAAHSAHYTAANASHIRVMLREDNLGLGAKIGGNSADTFGLATLSGIFGRLNGKSTEAIEKQQTALRDAELRSWQAQRFGFMTFVSGGFLIGDKIQEKTLDQPSKSSTSKKRDAEAGVDDLEKEAKVTRSSSPDEGAKTKERKRRRDPDNEAEAMDAKSSEKKRLKEEKRMRKEERRKRKAEKKARKGATDTETPDEDTTSLSPESQPTSIAPTRSGTQTPVTFAGSRHAVRQRYIQQKRLASMDPQALKEILMIQAGS